MDIIVGLFNRIWNLFGEYRTKAIVLSVIVALVSLAAGFYTCLKIYVPSLEMSRVAQNTISPPTNKEEDLSDIVKKLTLIESDIHSLRNGVEARITKDNMMIKCGINNGELSDWEVSVAGNNALNL